MTLWGKQAEQYGETEVNPVIAFKGVKVGEYQGSHRWPFELSRILNMSLMQVEELYLWSVQALCRLTLISRIALLCVAGTTLLDQAKLSSHIRVPLWRRRALGSIAPS